MVLRLTFLETIPQKGHPDIHTHVAFVEPTKTNFVVRWSRAESYFCDLWVAPRLAKEPKAAKTTVLPLSLSC